MHFTADVMTARSKTITGKYFIFPGWRLFTCFTHFFHSFAFLPENSHKMRFLLVSTLVKLSRSNRYFFLSFFFLLNYSLNTTLDYFILVCLCFLFKSFLRSVFNESLKMTEASPHQPLSLYICLPQIESSWELADYDLCLSGKNLILLWLWTCGGSVFVFLLSWRSSLMFSSRFICNSLLLSTSDVPSCSFSWFCKQCRVTF